MALAFTMGIFYKTCKSDPGLIPKCKSMPEVYRVSVGVWTRI